MFKQEEADKISFVFNHSTLLTDQYGISEDDDDWNQHVAGIDKGVFDLVQHMAEVIRSEADWFGDAEEKKFIQDCGWTQPLPEMEWERAED